MFYDGYSELMIYLTENNLQNLLSTVVECLFETTVIFLFYPSVSIWFEGENKKSKAHIN